MSCLKRADKHTKDGSMASTILQPPIIASECSSVHSFPQDEKWTTANQRAKNGPFLLNLVTTSRITRLVARHRLLFPTDISFVIFYYEMLCRFSL